MTITELIERLQEIRDESGDLKIFTNEEEYSQIKTENFESFNGFIKWITIVWKNDDN